MQRRRPVLASVREVGLRVVKHRFTVTCEVKDMNAKGSFHLRDFPIEAATASDAKSAARDRAYILSLEMRNVVSVKQVSR